MNTGLCCVLCSTQARKAEEERIRAEEERIRQEEEEEARKQADKERKKAAAKAKKEELKRQGKLLTGGKGGHWSIECVISASV